MFRIDRRFVSVSEPVILTANLEDGEEKGPEAAKKDLPKADGAGDARKQELPAEDRDSEQETERVQELEEPEPDHKPDKLDELLRITEEELQRAKKTAEEIISRSQAQAEEIEARARETLDQARAEAEDIRETAHSDAIARCEAELEARVQELEERIRAREEELEACRLEDSQLVGRLISEIGEARDRHLEDLEPDMVEFCLALSKKVVGMAIEKESNVYQAMVVKAIRQLKWDGKINLRVSKREYERFFTQGRATYSLGDEIVAVTAEEDEFLNPGDLIVETESETIDAGADTQFKRIEIAFHDMNG